MPSVYKSSRSPGSICTAVWWYEVPGINPSGSVYISDTFNNRIRQVAGGTITTYAGNGNAGFSGDGGPATLAKLNAPTGNVASDGNRVFIGDSLNERIRAVTSGPPPVIAESTYILLLPISALLLGGSWFVIARRRRDGGSAPAPAI